MWIHSKQHGHRPRPRLLRALKQQPARALRDRQAGERVGDGRKRLGTEHPSPIILNALEQVVRKEGGQDAKHDVELEHPGQTTAGCRRGDLGDVERRCDRGDTDSQAADEPGDDERPDVGRETTPDGRDEIEDANPEERRLTSQSVSRPSAAHRAHHGAIQRRGDRNAVHTGTQAPELLDRLLGTRDDDGIEAEQKAGKGRDDRPNHNTCIHE